MFAREMLSVASSPLKKPVTPPPLSAEALVTVSRSAVSVPPVETSNPGVIAALPVKFTDLEIPLFE